MSRQRPTFDALPYYDEDVSNNPELTAQVTAELAKEKKRLGQRVNPDHDPRIPPQFTLFSVGSLVPLSSQWYAHGPAARKTRFWPQRLNA